MAVKIRLSRRGRKKMAMYDVIIADAKSPRDGRIIEKLGYYNPLTDPATIVLNEQSALDWLLKGAQPTDTVRRILSHKGIMLKKHLQVGVLKGAITQELADKKFDEWLQSKEAEIAGNVDSITKKKADLAKARFEAEQKINEAKAEALKAKLAALVPVEEVAETVEAAPEVTEEVVAEATVTEKQAVEEKKEAPAEESKKEEKVEEAKAEVAEEKPAAEEPVAEKAEAPTEEKKEEAPVKEAVAEEKVEVAKAETTEEPVAEKEEAPAEEKKEEGK